MTATPPEVLTVGTVTIRRWRLDDAEALQELVLANLDHLRPWMPWVAAEPMSLEQRRSKVAEWCDQWDAGEDFTYAIVGDAGELLGVCSLVRPTEGTGLEIGYWVRGDRTRQGSPPTRSAPSSRRRSPSTA